MASVCVLQHSHDLPPSVHASQPLPGLSPSNTPQPRSWTEYISEILGSWVKRVGPLGNAPTSGAPDSNTAPHPRAGPLSDTHNSEPENAQISFQVTCKPKKRARQAATANGDEHSDGDSDEDRDPNKSRGVTARNGDRPIKVFACPFFKYNPSEQQRCRDVCFRRVRDMK